MSDGGGKKNVVEQAGGLVRAAQLARRVFRGGIKKVLRGLRLLHPPATSYQQWMRQRLDHRRDEYLAAVQPGLFSILTPVFRPPVPYLEALAASVFAQDYAEFEWVVVDNGNDDPAVCRLLRRMARDPRVRLLSFPTNLGIAGGTRQALLHARGRFILTVDHDDVLYPDALRVVAAYVQRFPTVRLFYSDEDKLLDGRPDGPFFKPDWDPVLFTNCCYPAHLMVLDRQLALEAGAYADAEVEGAQDWDAFARLVRAGCTPVHVPEILYSWRIHEGSTASAESGAKPYTVAAQQRVVRRFVSGLSSGGEMAVQVQPNPLYGRPGMWRLAAAPRQPAPPMMALLVAAGGAAERNAGLHALGAGGCSELDVRIVSAVPPASEAGLLDTETGCLRWQWLAGIGLGCAGVLSTLNQADDASLVAVLHDDVVPVSAGWAREAAILFERFPDTVAVGAKVVQTGGAVYSAGEVFGMDGLCGSPYRGQAGDSFGMYGGLICQRSVSAIDSGFFVTRAGFLKRLLRERSGEMSRRLLGAWLGAAARREGKRVVFTPHIVVLAEALWRPRVTASFDAADFVRLHCDLLLDDPFYSPFLSLESTSGYHIAAAEERARTLVQGLSLLAGVEGKPAALRLRPARYAAVERLAGGPVAGVEEALSGQAVARARPRPATAQGGRAG